MNKIALITDTHFGVRNNNLGLLNYFKEFYDNVFFPTLEERKIKTIIHLGDLVDNRKFINYNSSYYMRNMFLNKLAPYEVYIIAGNHDTFFKNTNQINSLTELVSNYPNIKVYISPTTELINGQRVLLLPWINQENEEYATELINNLSLDYCFAHLELSGFEMSIGSVASHGMKSNLFTKFSHVFTGHYHHKSSKDNIHYLGAPYEMTWSDYNDPRGFHILDLDTGSLEFIENPYKLYYKIIYDENDIPEDLSGYNKKYIKVIIKNKLNNLLYEKFIDDLEGQSPFDIQILETEHMFLENFNIDDVEKSKDALSVLNDCVKDLPDKINKEKLNIIFKDLYNKAMVMRG